MKCFKFLLFMICIINAEIVNKIVYRQIEFQGQHEQVEINIVMQNNGIESIDMFSYILDPDVSDFYVSFKDGNDNLLKYVQISSEPPFLFDVYLNNKFKPNKSMKLLVDLMCFGKIIPLQNTLVGRGQHVMYRGNLHFYSCFRTLSFTSILMLELDKKEHLQISHQPVNKTKYFEYVKEHIEPLDYEPFKIVYEDNSSFFTVLSLKRSIDVSHYGKISLTNEVTVKNEGRRVVLFPAMEYYRKLHDWWYMFLPTDVENIKYSDILGNSSKSEVSYFYDYVQLKFRPRYPLLSGWKTNYIVKYVVTLYNYLSRDLNKYVLKMRAVDHIINDVVIKEADVEILLPEGATVISVKLPDRFKRLGDVKRYAMLSNFGRPTIKFSGKNIYENYDKFEVEYLFHEYYLFRVPLFLIIYVESVFVFVIFFIHVKQF